MPYNSINSLPSFLKKYSEKKQRMWRYVFNSTWKKLTNEGVSTKDVEARAFKAANSVLKKQFFKKNGMEQNSRDDYFSCLIDQWLNNLIG